MEVNDKSVIEDDFYKYVEVPRKKLIESLTEDDKEKLINLFVKDIDQLKRFIEKGAVKLADYCGVVIYRLR